MMLCFSPSKWKVVDSFVCFSLPKLYATCSVHQSQIQPFHVAFIVFYFFFLHHSSVTWIDLIFFSFFGPTIRFPSQNDGVTRDQDRVGDLRRRQFR